MSNNNGETPEFRPRRSSAAVIIWLLVFGFIAVLFFVKFNPMPEVKSWNQSDFERELKAGNIKTVDMTSESERVMAVEGKYKLPGEVLKPAVGEPAAKVGEYRCRVVLSEELNKLLASHPEVAVKIKPKDTWWSALVVTVLPILIIVGVLYFLFSRQIKMAGKGAMQFGKSKARMIMPDDLKTTFNDIAGADEAKEEIQEIIEFLRDPIKFKLLGGKIPKGALLMGPPGTGKTLLAKAVACEANVPFFSISGSDFVEMFVGVGASRVRDMFEQARKHAPCLIFIDEIDAVGRSRFSGLGGGHDEREQTLNALLVEMDGLETQGGVIILAATNRPDVLDPALLRPGRFDRQIVLDLPDIVGRRKILDVHIKSIKVAEGVELDVIARGTPGFSGADLANLVNEGALLAARGNRDAVTMADLEEARDKVRWGRERRSRKISERERRLTAFHEAGHTLVALNCEHSSPVHKVTIIPRGQAYLGATMFLPDDDSYTQSRVEMLDELTRLLGGRVAEELVFGDITNGAAGDIEVATKIARAMVCTYGMNEKLGPVLYHDQSHPIYVRRDGSPFEGYSEATAREIDLEVKLLIEDAQNRARTMIRAKRGELDKLALELLERETLDAAEIRRLLGYPERTTPHVDTGVNVKVNAGTTAAADTETVPEPA